MTRSCGARRPRRRCGPAGSAIGAEQRMCTRAGGPGAARRAGQRSAGPRPRARRPRGRRGRRPPSARRVALDVLDRIDGGGRLRQPRPAGGAGALRASTPATGGSSPSSSTAPPACGGPATSSSTATWPRRRPAEVRNVLRLGAYQVAFAGVPPHAAVSETVAWRPGRPGLVNAVLRQVATEPVTWPDGGRPAERPRLGAGPPVRRPREDGALAASRP